MELDLSVTDSPRRIWRPAQGTEISQIRNLWADIVGRLERRRASDGCLWPGPHLPGLDVVQPGGPLLSSTRSLARNTLSPLPHPSAGSEACNMEPRRPSGQVPCCSAGMHNAFRRYARARRDSIKTSVSASCTQPCTNR